MKAGVVSKIGGACEVKEITLREPGPGEVKVKIAASGICHSDLSFQNGSLGGQAPIILGHEGAGAVTKVGPGVTAVEVGDHVILNWVPSCGGCFFCLRGETHLCSTRAQGVEPTHFMDGAPIAAVAGLGTFAEEALVPIAAVVKIPKDVPLDVGALIGCGVMTGAGAAINTAKVQPGSTVVVFGAGGVGINVIQGARVCGAAVILAVDRVPSKLDTARNFGATHAVLPEDLAAASLELTGGIGFDYAFEVIGLASTIRAAYDAARRGGTAVVVGAGRADEQVTFSPMELFVTEKKLIGSVYGSGNVRRDFPRLIALWRSGQMDLPGLISRRVRLDQVDDAFAVMSRGEVIRQVIDFGL